MDETQSAKQARKGAMVAAALSLLALGLIGAGAGMIYLPAGLIAPGLAIWLDLSIGGRRRP